MSSLETNILLRRKIKTIATLALVRCFAGLMFTGCSDQQSSGSDINETETNESETNESEINESEIY